ncbi:CLUMA_CG010222, isoform A [Clunio marinus]|uniref:CLUMA_CG010222, isoform A n=1 Tax=Clunio marinus TaxID=568069 RepID=A0A1J1I8Q2_9DIPT|nr:CLUMA_CG010222, isoform A [Clunio marinus]
MKPDFFSSHSKPISMHTCGGEITTTEATRDDLYGVTQHNHSRNINRFLKDAENVPSMMTLHPSLVTHLVVHQTNNIFRFPKNTHTSLGLEESSCK